MFGMESLTIGPFKNKLSPQKLGCFSGLIFSKDSSDCQSEKIFADKFLNVGQRVETTLLYIIGS